MKPEKELNFAQVQTRPDSPHGDYWWHAVLLRSLHSKSILMTTVEGASP